MAAAGKTPMRDALVAAAFELFAERGFEQTTIDDIVALAGVGRRSFFRYFRSKEAVVFPDHDGCLEQMRAFLDDPAGAGDDAVRRACGAAHVVLRLYSSDPEFSVRRYQLTRHVAALRAHELSVVWRYERAFGDFLRARFADRPEGRLHADVIAAGIVAAHNHALRDWLRADGRGDVAAALDRDLAFIRRTWPPTRPTTAPASAPATDATEDADDVVVLVARRSTPLWRVVQGVQQALDRSS